LRKLASLISRKLAQAFLISRKLAAMFQFRAFSKLFQQACHKQAASSVKKLAVLVWALR
jgi:hypothetical protein